MTEAWDAVVVGAGPNGLVAANTLADHGWSVLVLEAQPSPGGAVRSDREVHPEFVHDTFSAFYPLAAASPAIRRLELERHGLVWRHAPAVLGHQLSDGRWALLHRDVSRTAEGLEALEPGDGEAWLRLHEEWSRIGDEVIASLLTPFPPVRHGLHALRKLPGAGGLNLVKTLLSPVVELGRLRFRGEGPRLLLAGSAGHSDIPLDAPGSGLLGVLLTMMGHRVGYPVPAGGAGELTRALAERFTRLGGEIRCGEEVTAIDVAGRRAVGVRTADSRFTARRAVIADVGVQALYGRLVAAEHLPARVHRGMESFQLDPGTVKVDWALDGPVPWETPPAAQPGTVHLADSVSELSASLSSVAADAVPEQPFLIIGQMSTTDPGRSPAGTESVWAYTHVPHGEWPRDRVERFADVIQQRIERRAPGFGSRVLARRVLGPHEMEARNANLVGGAINGGSSQLHQQLVFRPVPGLGRAETPVRGLYLGSASAHPGGGVHGACGMNAARAALFHARLRL